jgi:hypothetical protein
VGQEPDPSADLVAVADRIQPEHGHPAGGHRHQPGAHPQQAGLSSPIRPLDQQCLAGGDLEVDAGEQGEPSRQRDGVLEN